jgi:hypothetical protein
VSVLELMLMALTVYRLARLVVKDTLPPVLWLRDRLVGGWRPLTQGEWEQIRAKAAQQNRVTLVDRLGSQADDHASQPVLAGRMFGPLSSIDGVDNRYLTRVSWSPHWLAELLSCPWCVGGWLAGAVTAATDLTVGVPLPWLSGFAVWAAGSWLASRSWT